MIEWINAIVHPLIALIHAICAYATELGVAWQAWLHPTTSPEMPVLWGHRMIWWSRLGKIMQLCGGLSIVFEIIGVERINAFGVRFGLRRRWEASLPYARALGNS